MVREYKGVCGYVGGKVWGDRVFGDLYKKCPLLGSVISEMPNLAET